MKSISIFLATLLVLSACSSYKKGEVVSSDDDEIRIQIGYDAAQNNVNTRRQAAEHCEDNDKQAVWYAHDAKGNLLYKCE